MNTRLDPAPSDPAVEAKGLGKRPAMLEGVEAARGEAAAVRWSGGGGALEPGTKALAIVERRDRRPEQLAHAVARPEDSSTARAVKPFVAPRGERVAPELRHRRVLDPEPVDAVHAEQDAIRQG